MKNVLAGLCLSVLAALAGSATAQSSAASPSDDAVMVVIQITLQPGAQADTALSVMSDMRALASKQPGFLSGSALQNANPANSPSYVHVSRWVSLKHWEGLFLSPEFAKLSAAGSKQVSVQVNAFKPLQ